MAQNNENGQNRSPERSSVQETAGGTIRRANLNQQLDELFTRFQPRLDSQNRAFFSLESQLAQYKLDNPHTYKDFVTDEIDGKPLSSSRYSDMRDLRVREANIKSNAQAPATELARELYKLYAFAPTNSKRYIEDQVAGYSPLAQEAFNKLIVDDFIQTAEPSSEAQKVLIERASNINPNAAKLLLEEFYPKLEINQEDLDQRRLNVAAISRFMSTLVPTFITEYQEDTRAEQAQQNLTDHEKAQATRVAKYSYRVALMFYINEMYLNFEGENFEAFEEIADDVRTYGEDALSAEDLNRIDLLKKMRSDWERTREKLANADATIHGEAMFDNDQLFAFLDMRRPDFYDARTRTMDTTSKRRDEQDYTIGEAVAEIVSVMERTAVSKKLMNSRLNDSRGNIKQDLIDALAQNNRIYVAAKAAKDSGDARATDEVVQKWNTKRVDDFIQKTLPDLTLTSFERRSLLQYIDTQFQNGSDVGEIATNLGKFVMEFSLGTPKTLDEAIRRVGFDTNDFIGKSAKYFIKGSGYLRVTNLPIDENSEEMKRIYALNDNIIAACGTSSVALNDVMFTKKYRNASWAADARFNEMFPEDINLYTANPTKDKKVRFEMDDGSIKEFETETYVLGDANRINSLPAFFWGLSKTEKIRCLLAKDGDATKFKGNAAKLAYFMYVKKFAGHMQAMLEKGFKDSEWMQLINDYEFDPGTSNFSPDAGDKLIATGKFMYGAHRQFYEKTRARVDRGEVPHEINKREAKGGLNSVTRRFINNIVLKRKIFSTPRSWSDRECLQEIAMDLAGWTKGSEESVAHGIDDSELKTPYALLERWLMKDKFFRSKSVDGVYSFFEHAGLKEVFNTSMLTDYLQSLGIALDSEQVSRLQAAMQAELSRGQSDRLSLDKINANVMRAISNGVGRERNKIKIDESKHIHKLIIECRELQVDTNNKRSQVDIGKIKLLSFINRELGIPSDTTNLLSEDGTKKELAIIRPDQFESITRSAIREFVQLNSELQYAGATFSKDAQERAKTIPFFLHAWLPYLGRWIPPVMERFDLHNSAPGLYNGFCEKVLGMKDYYGQRLDVTHLLDTMHSMYYSRKNGVGYAYENESEYARDIATMKQVMPFRKAVKMPDGENVRYRFVTDRDETVSATDFVSNVRGDNYISLQNLLQSRGYELQNFDTRVPLLFGAGRVATVQSMIRPVFGAWQEELMLLQYLAQYSYDYQAKLVYDSVRDKYGGEKFDRFSKRKKTYLIGEELVHRNFEEKIENHFSIFLLTHILVENTMLSPETKEVVDALWGASGTVDLESHAKNPQYGGEIRVEQERMTLNLVSNTSVDKIEDSLSKEKASRESAKRAGNDALSLLGLPGVNVILGRAINWVQAGLISGGMAVTQGTMYVGIEAAAAWALNNYAAISVPNYGWLIAAGLGALPWINHSNIRMIDQWKDLHRWNKRMVGSGYESRDSKDAVIQDQVKSALQEHGTAFPAAWMKYNMEAANNS